MGTLSEAEREKIKIRANLWNGLAIASMAVGFVAVALRTPNLFSPEVNLWEVLGSITLAFALCVAFHIGARMTLDQLDR